MVRGLDFKKASLLAAILVLAFFMVSTLVATNTASAVGCKSDDGQALKLGCDPKTGKPIPNPGGTIPEKSQPCAKNTFFGLVPWYQYLTVNQKTNKDGSKYCDVDFQASQLLSKTSPILLIVFAVIDDLLRIAGMIAVVFIIIGGFKFITSSGEPEAAAGAKKTITYAVIGLVIALLAVVIVSFIGSALGA